MYHYRIRDDYKTIDMIINVTTGVNHARIVYFDDTRKPIELDLPFTKGTNLNTYSYNLLQSFE